MGYILHHEDYFRTIMEEQLRVESCEQIRIRRKRLESNERRIAELKRLFIKIYEDNASRRLTDERYDMLSQTYEAEQKQLEAEAITLQQEIEVQERQNENIEKFIQKAHKYVGIEELDGHALRELVSAVYVDAPGQVQRQAGTAHPHQVRRAGLYPSERADEKGNGVTEVTPPLENTRFSPFFDFTVLRPPGYVPAAVFRFFSVFYRWNSFFV